MKTFNFTIFCFLALLFSLSAFGQTWYARGDFNGWGTSDQLYDDGTNGDPVAGDSIYSKLITIAAAGRYEWKVATSDWSTSYPSSNSWLRTTNNNVQLLFTFDANFYPDVWLPNTNIINCSDQIPPSNNVVAVGDHNSWNNSGTEIMHDDGLDGDWQAGDGIFAYHIIVASPGSYNWKPTWYGTWDAWGSDNRSINSANVSYSTTSSNEDVYFYLDSNTGRVATASNPLPVELISFKAILEGNVVSLSWQTATELNNRGFEIERKTGTSWEQISFVPGSGTTTALKSYYYEDNIIGINSDIIYYRLKQIDFNGSFEYSNVIEVKFLPDDFYLSQNFPNPFNPATKISFVIGNLEGNSVVTLKVYDLTGNEVATLVNEELGAGKYQVEFSATGVSSSGGNNSQLSSGIYFYELKAGSFIQSRKMLLLK